jgi:hypothetical protein
VHDSLLGPLTYVERFRRYASEAKSVGLLGGRPCRFVLEGYADDPRPDEIRAAIQRVLESGPGILSAAQPHVVRYCEEMLARYSDRERPAVRLEKPSDVWSYVQFGSIFYVSRRADGDAEDGVYLSLECSCDWEVEHGLQLVLRDGRAVTKVGPFDGHLTNADAFADPKLVGIVYRPLPPYRGPARGR